MGVKCGESRMDSECASDHVFCCFMVLDLADHDDVWGQPVSY